MTATSRLDMLVCLESLIIIDVQGYIWEVLECLKLFVIFILASKKEVKIVKRSPSPQVSQPKSMGNFITNSDATTVFKINEKGRI